MAGRRANGNSCLLVTTFEFKGCGCSTGSWTLRGHTAPKSLQSCPTLCDPMDCSLPDFSVQGIHQARTLEWVAISFSHACKWKVKVKSLSRVRLLATPWTAAHQAPPSMGFSRQQYWSGVPLPSPRWHTGYTLILYGSMIHFNVGEKLWNQMNSLVLGKED